MDETKWGPFFGQYFQLYSKCTKYCCILIKISPEFVSRFLTGNEVNWFYVSNICIYKTFIMVAKVVKVVLMVHMHTFLDSLHSLTIMVNNLYRWKDFHIFSVFNMAQEIEIHRLLVYTIKIESPAKSILNKSDPFVCGSFLPNQKFTLMADRPWARGVHHAPPTHPPTTTTTTTTTTSLQNYVFLNPQSVHNKKWDANSKNIGTHYWFTALF